jgi:hypothetical protein
MNTIQEVHAMLSELEKKEGREAVDAWIAAHAGELSEEVRDELIFNYSTDAMIADAKDYADLDAFERELISDAAGTEAEINAIQAEIKKREVQERLGIDKDTV